MKNLPNHLKIEKINNKLVMYQLYVDLYNYLDRKIFILDQIEENLFTNIKIIECETEIYKSKCVAELRTKLTLDEVIQHVINPNINQNNLSAVLTLSRPRTPYPIREQNSKIEYLSKKYLSDVINFLEKKPTEKEVLYLIKKAKLNYFDKIRMSTDNEPSDIEIEIANKKEEKNTKNINKLLDLPRWKMQLAINCASALASPTDLTDFVYTALGDDCLFGYYPKYISDSYSDIIKNKYGQLADDYDLHKERIMVGKNEKCLTDKIKKLAIKKIEKIGIRQFCSRNKTIYEKIKKLYLDKPWTKIPDYLKKEYEFMCDEKKISELYQGGKNV